MKRGEGRAAPNAAPADVLDWAHRFLPDYFCEAAAAFHRELLADVLRAEKRCLARVAPRGHAKSTCLAMAYPLWCICHQRRRNIVLITHAAALATQFVRDIRQELECNERIRKVYGELCPSRRPARPARSADRARTTRTQRRGAAKQTAAPMRRRWSSSSFTTSTGVTVQAKGVGASFRGTRVGPHRPDLVICDDVEKDEQVESPEARRKLEAWLRRVVMPALHPQGQLLVVGSIIHYDSLLAGLSDPTRYHGWDYRVYRAVECAPDAGGRYQRVALWPARWPIQRLDEERRRIGAIAFEQEYQANPIDDSLRVFRPEWLRRYDARELEQRRLTNLIAVDPATGATGGDFFALWVGSLDRDSGTLYTRVLSLERIGLVQQVQRILAAFSEWRPVRIGIETVGYQVALKHALEEESRKRGLYLPIVGIRSTANKRERIEGSSAQFENGTFRLPALLDPEVEAQFLHYPKADHDDAPDVCAMGIEMARSLRGGKIDGAVPRESNVRRW